MHHLDQERNLSSSTINMDYGMNGMRDNEIGENPRKRASHEPPEPVEQPRRRAIIAVSRRRYYLLMSCFLTITTHSSLHNLLYIL